MRDDTPSAQGTMTKWDFDYDYEHEHEHDNRFRRNGRAGVAYE